MRGNLGATAICMNVNDFYYLMQALVENQREYSRNLEFSLSMSMSMGYFALKSMSHSYSYNYSYSYGPQKRQLRNRHRKNDSVEIDDGRRREMVRTSSKPKYYVVRRFVLIFLCIGKNNCGYHRSSILGIDVIINSHIV